MGPPQARGPRGPRCSLAAPSVPGSSILLGSGSASGSAQGPFPIWLVTGTCRMLHLSRTSGLPRWVANNGELAVLPGRDDARICPHPHERRAGIVLTLRPAREG